MSGALAKRAPRLGDRVLIPARLLDNLLAGILGDVVGDLDADEFSDGFPADDWRVLGSGLLVDADAPVGLIHIADPNDVEVIGDEELADAWIAVPGTRYETASDGLAWPADEVSNIVSRDAERALEIAILIARRAQDDQTLVMLGLLFEDLLAELGSVALERLRQESVRTPGVRAGLGNVWSSFRMTADVWEALERFRRSSAPP